MAGGMEAIIGGLTNLIGSEGVQSIFKTLGSEGFANLIKGGTALYSANQTGDFMDFQKDLMTKSEGRTQTLFNNDQADRTARQNIDWTSGIETPAPYG